MHMKHTGASTFPRCMNKQVKTVEYESVTGITDEAIVVAEVEPQATGTVASPIAPGDHHVAMLRNRQACLHNRWN